MDFIRNIHPRDSTIPSGSKSIRDDLPILLLALVPMAIIVPVLPSGFSSRMVIVFFLTLLFITGIYCMRGDRRRFLMSCIFALIATESFWVSLWPSASSLFLPAEFFLLLFLTHLAAYLSWELIFSEGTIFDEISIISALLLTGGMILGTGLHLAGLISKTVRYDPATIHSSFALAIPEGVMLLIRGGDHSFGTSPLVMIILMAGTMAGFLLLIVSAGKIASIYIKKNVANEEKERN